MKLHNVAQKYVDGVYDELNGIGLHDAVHVLATQNQLNKADLRAAIIDCYATEIPTPEEIYVELDGVFDNDGAA